MGEGEEAQGYSRGPGVAHTAPEPSVIWQIMHSCDMCLFHASGCILQPRNSSVDQPAAYHHTHQFASPCVFAVCCTSSYTDCLSIRGPSHSVCPTAARRHCAVLHKLFCPQCQHLRVWVWGCLITCITVHLGVAQRQGQENWLCSFTIVLLVHTFCAIPKTTGPSLGRSRLADPLCSPPLLHCC